MHEEKPCEEERNEEIGFFLEKLHSCQSALTAVGTFDGVCTHVHCADSNKGTVISVRAVLSLCSCYLFDKHLHMKNLHSVFIPCPVCCSDAAHLCRFAALHDFS